MLWRKSYKFTGDYCCKRRCIHVDLQLGAGRPVTNRDGFEDVEQPNKLQKVPRARWTSRSWPNVPFFGTLMFPCWILLWWVVHSSSCHIFLLLKCLFLYQCQQFSCLPLHRGLSLVSAAEDTNSSCMWTQLLPCSLEGFSRFSHPGSDV